ncbi:DUF1592 domain-containing protein [Lignipirellula cremea]|nr:DUF1592 domain-containing protein [Lignipirellula cremea]
MTRTAWFLLLLAATPALAAEPTESFEQAVEPYFQTYCLRCHNAEKQAGQFRLDTLSQDFVDLTVAQRWSEVMTRIHAGEMPPEDEPQPAAEQTGKAVDWITARIHEGEAARMANRGPVAHYRLSREEYAYTLYDLLGVHYDVTLPGAFSEDPRWHGFERLGSMLSLAPSHMERYFTAAEAVLAQAYPLRPVKQIQTELTAAKAYQKQLDQLGVTAPVRWVVWPQRRIPALRRTAKEPGVYRAKVRLSGLPSISGITPHLAVWHQGLKRTVFDQDILAPENEPVTITFELPLSGGDSLDLLNDTSGPLNEGHTVSGNVGSLFISTTDHSLSLPWSRKLTDDAGNALYPLLIVDSIEWEGPLVNEADLQKRASFLPESLDDLVETRDCLHRFAERAWRRPVADVEIDRYLRILAEEKAAGESPHSALMAAMAGVLTSSNFFYLVEGSQQERRDRVNDWELASRLSYFLWGSLPDDELIAAARQGRLHDPQVLDAQLTRMLADPKCGRFTESFCRQWLQLHQLGMFPPDAKLYPDYDTWLEKSMRLETTGFFAEVFTKNLSLREFLTSDWTILNPRLARHYQMPIPETAGFQRTNLRPDDHRGGLLTQAAILSLTSDGTRHRPVHRGVWVSEAIYGVTPSPPPPNVEPLETTPANQPKATIRMQLEAHASNASCASCHRKIDPLGFAFDNYDAIGRWRETEQTISGRGENPPVNASGMLPSGETFQGPAEFKQLLADDLDRFAEAFVENLATFALRRAMTVDDAAAIRAIALASQQDDYRLQAVIRNLVLSDLFQKR